jgi:hypothetical protein
MSKTTLKKKIAILVNDTEKNRETINLDHAKEKVDRGLKDALGLK